MNKGNKNKKNYWKLKKIKEKKTLSTRNIFENWSLEIYFWYMHVNFLWDLMLSIWMQMWTGPLLGRALTTLLEKKAIVNLARCIRLDRSGWIIKKRWKRYSGVIVAVLSRGKLWMVNSSSPEGNRKGCLFRHLGVQYGTWDEIVILYKCINWLLHLKINLFINVSSFPLLYQANQNQKGIFQIKGIPVVWKKLFLVFKKQKQVHILQNGTCEQGWDRGLYEQGSEYVICRTAD